MSNTTCLSFQSFKYAALCALCVMTTFKIKLHVFFFFMSSSSFLSPASSSSSSPSELSECPASEGSSQASASGCSNQPDELGAAAAAGSLQITSGPKPGTSSSATLNPTTPRVTPMNGPLPPG